MTHVRDFLATAAPEPREAFDATAFVRRARSNVWRRSVGWGAMVVGGLLAAGGGWTQLAPADNGGAPRPSETSAEQRVARPAEGTASPTPGGVGAAAEADGTRAASGGGSASVAGAPRVSAGTSAGESSADERNDRLGTFSRLPTSSSEGCEAGTGETCTYVATVPAGYRGYGTYSITIERSGRTTTYTTPAEDQAQPYPCRDPGFIQPGDRVTVSVPEGAPQAPWPSVTSPNTKSPPPGPPPSPDMGHVAVGPDHHC